MAYGAITTLNDDDTVTKALINQIINDLAETAPAKALVKGDLFPATGAGVLGRLAISTDGLSLVLDSSQTTGMKWGNPITYTGIGDEITRFVPTNTITPGSGAYKGAHWNPAGTMLAVTTNAAATGLVVFPYSVSQGFGPGVVQSPGFAPIDMAWSPDGAYIGVVGASSPFVKVYPWSGTAFGAAVSNPGTLPAGTAADSIAWNPAGTYVAIGSNATPWLQVYAWAAGFGAKSANPGVLPTAGGNIGRLAWAPSGLSLAYAITVSPYLEGYPFAAGVIGTKFSNPATIPTGQTTSIAINAAGDLVAVGHGTTPFMSVYPYSDSTGFGTKLTNPTELPDNAVNALRWHEVTIGGVAVKQLLTAASSTNVPNTMVYGFSGGVFSNQNRAIFQMINAIITGAGATPPFVQQESQNGPSIDINPINYHIAFIRNVAFGSAPASNNMLILVPNSG